MLQRDQLPRYQFRTLYHPHATSRTPMTTEDFLRTGDMLESQTNRRVHFYGDFNIADPVWG